MATLMIFLVLVILRNSQSCSSPFTNIGVPLTVDYSTNVGVVVYTLINENDPVDVEMEANIYLELNPANDHEVIVKTCLPTSLIYSFGVKVVGDSSFCYLIVRSGPATPVFTNPSDVIIVTSLPPVSPVLFHVTLDNDVCGSFSCTASCTNVPEMNPVYDGNSHEVRTLYFGLQYNIVYAVEVQCLDFHKLSFITANHTQTVYVTFRTSNESPTTTPTPKPPTTAATSTALTTTTPTTSATTTAPTNRPTTTTMQTTKMATRVTTTTTSTTQTTHSTTTFTPSFTTNTTTITRTKSTITTTTKTTTQPRSTTIIPTLTSNSTSIRTTPTNSFTIYR